MRSIREAGDLKGKRVLVRASLNEPIDGGVLRSDFRLKKMLPLITLLCDAGARTILAGHLSGDPEGKTLAPVARYFGDSIPVTFIEDVFNDSSASIRSTTSTVISFSASDSLSRPPCLVC